MATDEPKTIGPFLLLESPMDAMLLLLGSNPEMECIVNPDGGLACTPHKLSLDSGAQFTVDESFQLLSAEICQWFTVDKECRCSSDLERLNVRFLTIQ